MWKTLFRICLCHIEAYLIAAGFPGWRVDADADVDVDATDPMSQFRVYSTRKSLLNMRGTWEMGAESIENAVIDCWGYDLTRYEL